MPTVSRNCIPCPASNPADCECGPVACSNFPIELWYEGQRNRFSTADEAEIKRNIKDMARNILTTFVNPMARTCECERCLSVLEAVEQDIVAVDTRPEMQLEETVQNAVALLDVNLVTSKPGQSVICGCQDCKNDDPCYIIPFEQDSSEAYELRSSATGSIPAP
jgi:hypothetical protein